jgi:hypothetical protein
MKSITFNVCLNLRKDKQRDQVQSIFYDSGIMFPENAMISNLVSLSQKQVF